VFRGRGSGGVLRGALLGTGSIAPYHMRAWKTITGVEIIALANRTRERAIALAREFGIDDSHVYSNYRELLERESVDFVDIVTAPHVHYEQVVAAAEYGVHVICQKPLATSMEEAHRMIQVCKAAGVRCVVNENWRWRRWYREIKRLLDEGAIGEPWYASFRVHSDTVIPRADGSVPELLSRQPYTREMPRLILYEWGIHLVDVLRFLFGDVLRVYARMSRSSPLVAGEDRAVVLLEFPLNRVALLDISWSSLVPEDRRLGRGHVEPFTVEGDLGTIELDPYADDLLTICTLTGVERRSARSGLSPAEAYQESFIRAMEDFVESLRTGRPAETEAEDNIKTLATVFAAYESAESGTPIDVRVMTV
jgi:predicted dehydrogenase